MRNTGTRSLLVIIDILIEVIAALCAAFLVWKDSKAHTKRRFPALRHSPQQFFLRSRSNRRLGSWISRKGACPAGIPWSDLGAVEVQVGPRRCRAALVLIPGAVYGRSVRVLSGGAGSE
jgi:hypothetical protein